MSVEQNILLEHRMSIIRDRDDQSLQMIVNEDGSINTSSTEKNTVLDTVGRNTVVAVGSPYTSPAVDVSTYSSVVVACRTDQSGSFEIQFSVDGENWDSALTYLVAANTNEVHRIVVTRKYFRVVFTNTSGLAQSYFRLQAIAGDHPALTSPLNSTIQIDADTTVVRPLDFNLMVAEGRYQNHGNFLKEGLNIDIDSASVPEDINNEGGVYAGFPTTAPEEGQIVVSGADTGTVVYAYLATSDDTDYTFATKAITGVGNYNLGHNIWRCNFAYFISSNPAVFNVGAITIRHAVTTTNVFCVIDPGFSQSYCSAYTVPAGSAIYLDRVTGNMRGTSTGAMDGAFFYRPFGESPRLRFPFELQYGTLYFDDVDYLNKIPAKVDICPRITYSSANNLVARISYRFIKVKET